MIAKEFQWHDVPREILFEPFPAECEGAELLIDRAEKLGGLCVPDWFLVVIKLLHVVAAVDVLPNSALARGAEGLNRILLAFLHFVLIRTLDYRDTLACMDLIPLDAMSAQVLNRLYSIGFALYFNFVRLHGLLDGFTNLTEACINS